jgi:Protein of unknown function (DUF3341)
MAMNGTSKPYGMIAEFTTAADVLHAAQKVRDAGCTRWDVFTPFPVHGLDRAMGMRNPTVGWFSFLGGAQECFESYPKHGLSNHNSLSLFPVALLFRPFGALHSELFPLRIQTEKGMEDYVRVRTFLSSVLA